MNAYKCNLRQLFASFRRVLRPETLLIWTTALPVSQTVRGGVILDTFSFLSQALLLLLKYCLNSLEVFNRLFKTVSGRVPNVGRSLKVVRHTPPMSSPSLLSLSVPSICLPLPPFPFPYLLSLYSSLLPLPLL